MLLATPRSALAADALPLELQPLGQNLATDEGRAPTAVPGPGEIIALGRFDAPGLAIDDIRQVTVLAPDGRTLPLHVETPSIFVEFDKIVSLRFFFVAGVADLAASPKPFLLKWGTNVRADNVEVARIVLDPARKEAYREFRWRPQAPAVPPEASIARIEVIADSHAEYYFLWYLLPMALTFLLLTIRKIRANRPTDRSAS
ncbi:MAG: hypothetical protein V2A58_09520 [Planctomycetota bacterium]